MYTAFIHFRSPLNGKTNGDRRGKRDQSSLVHDRVFVGTWERRTRPLVLCWHTSFSPVSSTTECLLGRGNEGLGHLFFAGIRPSAQSRPRPSVCWDVGTKDSATCSLLAYVLRGHSQSPSPIVLLIAHTRVIAHKCFGAGVGWGGGGGWWRGRGVGVVGGWGWGLRWGRNT